VVRGPLRRHLDDLLGEQGFASWGVAAAGPLEREHETLLGWIASGRHGPLEYMRALGPVLRDPSHERFLPGARTVVVASLSFPAGDPPAGSLARLLARHARGRDYHEVVGERLARVLDSLGRSEPGLRGRVFVDAAPVMEKAWARRAGLGWIGKNGLLVREGLGSTFVLGGIALTGEMEPDEPAADRCGDCSACVDACPTGALAGDRLVDARRCLACITVEGRGTLTEADAALVAGRLAFGCDLCQEACPYNASPPPGDPGLAPERFALEMSPREFLSLPGDEARSLLEGTAMARAGVERLRSALAAAGAGAPRRSRDATSRRAAPPGSRPRGRGARRPARER
jgi:epoxyqueuosine reductase